MGLSYTHGREFVRQLNPILARGDVTEVLEHLERYWPNQHLRELLTCGHDDAKKIALCCLSLTGTLAEDEPVIAPLLHEDDGLTVALAEQAIWSIWFSSGERRASIYLIRAVRLIAEDRLDDAINLLNELAARYPTFAEIYNQRAIARFLKGEYVLAVADCRETLRLNKSHFGAWASLGHGYALLGELDSAIDAYRQALALHPGLEGIRESIHEVRRSMRGAKARQAETSGEPQAATD